MKMSKLNKWLLAACCFLLGVLIGGMLMHSFTFTVVENEQYTERSCHFFERMDGEALVYTRTGDVKRCAQGFRVTEALQGVILNPPALTNMDVYTQARAWLEAGERVLILYLDGFGWESFCFAQEQGLIPHLSALNAQRAAAMYPSITPVNYAAMVTGKAPADNGVTARGMHDLKCDTIFDLAAAQGKRSFIAEGDAQILRFNVPQELNLDMDEDGDTDSEVIACALANMAGCDLMLVHLHGIDDSGHAYGPRAQETLRKIAQTDQWFAQLAAAWQGRILVAADHGQHENDGSGDAYYADKRGVHGAFAPSDLYVPFLMN